MEAETSVKEGYLLFPPHGMLGQLKFQKSWHKKYCQLFNLSQHGIERLEIFDSEDDARKSSSVRIITLENCVKISQDSQKHQQFVIMVVTKTLTQHFAAFSQQEMLDWVVALQSVAFPCETTTKTVEEDNELYCSSAEGVYYVKLIPTEASKRCGLAPGCYTLICLESEIQLMGHSRILLTWPYRYIRRYGQREGTFTFEAGRKCPSGAGSFHFGHVNGIDIFRCISSRMKNMRKVLDGGTNSGEFPPLLPSPPATQDLDKTSGMSQNYYWSNSKNDESGSNVSLSNAPTVCVDDLLQAALNNMEAGSRSPLSAMPPFGSGLSISMDTISSSLEDKPMKPARNTTKSLKASKKLQVSQAVHGINIKQKINELTLKGSNMDLPVQAQESSDLSSQHSYDKVEFRKDAWRTMGITEMPHQETSTTTENDASFQKKRKNHRERLESEAVKVANKPKIIVNSQDSDYDDANYDKLQHLGTQTSKRSVNSVDTRYKQVTPITLSSVEAQAPMQLKNSSEDITSEYQTVSWNPYDDVENCMQAVRLADDSHLGYGMIRKKTLEVNDPGNVNIPSHTTCNEIEYAVIEKPKKSSPKP